MSPPVARILLVADSHLGFDLPSKPRVERRRRGHDFFTNLERALQPAMQGEVDLVVHGGDLFHRSRVSAAVVERAFGLLARVAAQGTPIYIVPGNHERACIPHHLWTAHSNIHIFDAPKTYLCPVGSSTLALSGFPFYRGVGDRFAELVERTGYRDVDADVRLLCIHQTVEGAQVGPGDYTFRRGPEVIHGKDIPGAFHAILAGHIHRAQVLTHDLSKRPLAAPVIYPGSVERTSFAERNEAKGYVILCIDLCGRDAGRVADISFVPLPARPMMRLVLEAADLAPAALRTYVEAQLAALDPDAIVRVRILGPNGAPADEGLSAADLRSIAPPSMNISLAYDR